jgi:predicted Zn-dependent protease
LQVLAALVLARAGDLAPAKQMAAELAKRFPLNTALNDYWLPAIRAAIEIDRKDPARAVEMLQAATPYDRGNPLPQVEVGACMYPAYLRGESYLQLHRGKEAAAEFQAFREHRGIVVNCPLGALARLGLARAYALEGDREGSRKEYREFLILWKDADPDLTVLKAAKSEYAALSSRQKETSRLTQTLR